MEHKGFFITIEGIDGSGKSVLAERLKQQLEKSGSNVLLTRQPGGSAFGKHLREILQMRPDPISAKTEFLLFAADRAHHIETVVLPALRKGSIVISDRCADSSVAYQGYGRGLDCSMIKTVNRWAMGGLEPDLTLYIKVDIDTALKRIFDSREVLTTFEKEKRDFWPKVSNGFDEIFAQRDNVVNIDGSLDEQTVFQHALEKIVEVIGR